MSDAGSFILQRLSAGPLPAEVVKAHAKAEGITDITLRRAREDLMRRGLMRVYKGSGYGTPWYWTLIRDHGEVHEDADRHRRAAVEHRDVPPLEPEPPPPPERSAVARMWDRGVEAVKKTVTT